jgi:hypothetical protein
MDDPLFIVMVPADGANVLPVPTINIPPIEKLLEVVTVPESAIVILLNVKDPELEMDDPLFIVTVPPEAVNVELVPFVNTPVRVKLLDVVTVAALAMMRFVKIKVPELAIDAPLFIVIVPDGANRELVPSVKAPLIVKSLDVVTVAEFARVKPENVSVPELEIDDPLFMVMVPLLAIRLPVTLNAEATAKVADVVTPLPLMVRFP